ncbi:MAG TPA: hypothetical protein DCM64_12375 [Gammaproteobacteria bacterium]|jgi:hypothetical protein|nr:2TM domain-containing protein [Gammaproteobacteria bacterium]MDP6731547.1 2TM domain-containing protein [Gammaproteobacteria bacterium]HAJ77236.1 hypothetical protein [Gammaproteobacteria bacterium]|tara:strand:+ start:3852 stop:4742 length:891 start_codon:yes stop_codon:yes gene_type:complete
MADILKIDKNSVDSQDSENMGTAEMEKPSSTDKYSDRRYSSEEVADIIRLGLQEEISKAANTIDHEELIAIGKEVGVNDEQIDRAVHLLQEEQQTRDKEKFLWLRFKAHVAVFLGVNLLCITLNLITGMTVFWAGYVLLGMGLFLLGHYAGLRYAPEFVEMAMHRTRLYAQSKYQAIVEDDDNVGFTIGDTSGLMQTEGLMFIEEDGLVIEHQTIDGMLGLFKTSIKETEIPLADITRVKLEQGFWSSELVLHGRSLRTLRHLPGRSSGTVRLKINRQSNRAAQNLVNEINKRKQP